MTYKYTYTCLCECNFKIEIDLKREIDFEVLCVRTGCDLIMNPILKNKELIEDSLFENQIDFE